MKGRFLEVIVRYERHVDLQLFLFHLMKRLVREEQILSALFSFLLLFIRLRFDVCVE